MKPTTKRLVAFAILLLALQIVAIPVAIGFKLAYQFGGPGDPNKVASDFFFSGTAITAPVVPILLALVLLIILVRNARWWGTLGAVGFCIVALLMFIGSLGEVLAPDTPDVPRWVLVASGVVNAGLSLTLLLFALTDLRDRLRTRRPLAFGSG